MKCTKFMATLFVMVATPLASVPNSHAAMLGAKTNELPAGYTSIIVEKFTIGNNTATENFPRGYETIMPGETVKRLRKRGIFEHVIEGEKPVEGSNPSPGDVTQLGKTFTLSGTVISYDKGSRAARYLVNFGAGATKVKVRYEFRDAQAGQEVLRIDAKGNFMGSSTCSVVAALGRTPSPCVAWCRN